MATYLPEQAELPQLGPLSLCIPYLPGSTPVLFSFLPDRNGDVASIPLAKAIPSPLST